MEMKKTIKSKKQEEELYWWCLEQAKAYKEKTLTKEQLKKLKDIKFPFDYYLKEYKRLIKEHKKMRR